MEKHFGNGRRSCCRQAARDDRQTRPQAGLGGNTILTAGQPIGNRGGIVALAKHRLIGRWWLHGNMDALQMMMMTGMGLELLLLIMMMLLLLLLLLLLLK